MLTEQTIVDKIEIDAHGNISVRQATVIFRDGVPVPTPLQYHRISYEPGADISNEDARVQALAHILWTEEVIDAATARREAALAQLITQTITVEEKTP